MFMFKNESDEAYEQDRRRVMAEILNACLSDRHVKLMQAYGLPEDFMSPQGLEVAASPMRVVSPRQDPMPQGPLRSVAAAGYRRAEGGARGGKG